MASSELDICNMALSHLGISTEIADMTERTKEAQACRRFYDQVVAETLRDFPWGWATTFGALALVADQPTVEWLYSYRLPANCARFIRVLNGVTRLDSENTRVPFKKAVDSQGAVLLCDLQDAQGEWTTSLTDASLFPPDFAQTVSLYLASLIAARVTKGDDFKLGDRAFKLYLMRRDAAWANEATEGSADQPLDDSFTRARD